MVLATDLNVLVEPVPIRQVYAAMIQDTGLAEGRDRSHGSREDAVIPVAHGENMGMNGNSHGIIVWYLNMVFIYGLYV